MQKQKQQRTQTQQKSIHTATRKRHPFNPSARNFTAIVVTLCLFSGIGFGIYHERQVNAYQSRASRQAKKNELSCTVYSAPHSRIYSDGNEIGHADKNGAYPVGDASVGTKLVAKYGANTSEPLILTRDDANHNVSFTFNYLKGDDAQQWLKQLYSCEADFANHNDQMSSNHSLDDFFVRGGQNDDYSKLSAWSKNQYKLIQHMKSDRRQHKIKNNDLVAVHFITNVDSTQLNPNGTETMDYTVKYDSALPNKDQIQIMKGSLMLTKINGTWKVLKENKPLTVLQHYTE